MEVRTLRRGRARVLGVLALTMAMLPLSAVEIVAWAEVPDVVATEVSFDTDRSAFRVAKVGGQLRSTPAGASQRFSSVGFELPEGAEAWFRTADEDGSWGPWSPVPVLDPDEGPDPDSPEARDDGDRRFSDAIWVEDASDIQVQVEGASPEEVRATLIDAAGLNGAGTVRVRVRPQAAEARNADGLKPRIITRAQWGANESWRSSRPSYARNAGAGIVHHTAGRNGYAAGDVPAILRAIYHYHTNARGWSDIGYNFLVDRFGRVYEGRYGGMGRAVIGAHARNHNTGSIGISVLGNYANGAAYVPKAALDAIADTLGWKFALHGIDPYGKYTHRTGKVTATVIGHTDVGSTSCPGDIHRYLGQLKGMVASAMLPFKDVVYGGAHYDAIVRLWSDGLVNGCKSDLFCPWNELTRAQAATMLTRAFGIPLSDEDRFGDIAASPHRRAINGLAAAGLIQGIAEGVFDPMGNLKRSHVATILAGVLEIEHVEGDQYGDVPAHHPHAGAIYGLKAEKVVGGCGDGAGGFCPDMIVLRAQMSSMMNSGLDWRVAKEAADRPLAGEPADTEARLPDEPDPVEEEPGEAPPVDPGDPVPGEPLPGEGDEGEDGGGEDGGGEEPPPSDVVLTWEELVLAWLDGGWPDGATPAGWPAGWDATWPANWPEQWRTDLRGNRWPEVWRAPWREGWHARADFF